MLLVAPHEVMSAEARERLLHVPRLVALERLRLRIVEEPRKRLLAGRPKAVALRVPEGSVRAAIVVRRYMGRPRERLRLDVDDHEPAALRPSDHEVAVGQFADGVEVRELSRQVDASRRHGVRSRDVHDRESAARGAHEDSLPIVARLALVHIVELAGKPRRHDIRILGRLPLPHDLRRLRRHHIRIKHHDARLRLLRAHDNRTLRRQ